MKISHWKRDCARPLLKKNLRPNFFLIFFFFGCVFVGDPVTPMSTLAHNKRSCSKKRKISGQNNVFPVMFPAKKLARFYHAVLDSREHQGLPPDLFDHARSIAMPGQNRQWRFFRFFGVDIVKKKFFQKARLLVLIYTPKEAHSRIFVTAGSVIAWQMLAKKKYYSWGGQLVVLQKQYMNINTVFWIHIDIVYRRRMARYQSIQRQIRSLSHSLSLVVNNTTSRSR